MTASATETQPAATGRSATYAWIALCAITVGSWWLAPGHGGGTARPSVTLTVAVVALGLVKGRLIIRHFMEVGAAPRWLRLATDAWLLTLWAAVLALYLY